MLSKKSVGDWSNIVRERHRKWERPRNTGRRQTRATPLLTSIEGRNRPTTGEGKGRKQHQKPDRRRCYVCATRKNTGRGVSRPRQTGRALGEQSYAA
ncbi:unnamed protein product [Linum trigynum]|uniref:Uncharacterized protein n=1 Tax=Linum trigynum TaxID=586398 RepID=A0AAV2DJR3_9ROSI